MASFAQEPVPILMVALSVWALTASLHFTHAAQQDIVGGSAGWTIPAVGNVNYSTWADDGSSFHVGDTLLFKYDATLHDVVEVTKEDYENCSAATPLARYDDGNTVIALDVPGIWYFICGVPGHCSAGQKVAVDVSAELAPAPALAPVPAQVEVWAPVPAPTPALVPASSSPPYASGPSPVISSIIPSSIGSVAPSTKAASHPTTGGGPTRAPATEFKITGAIACGAFLASLWLAASM